MSVLSLNLNGNVDVITIEDLGDRQRIFVGDVDSGDNSKIPNWS